MSIIKETIKSNGLDTTIKFSLGGNNRLSGYQQEIDNLTEQTKEDLVNPIIDNEVRRFQYDSAFAGSSYLWFYFSYNGSSAYNAFTSSGAGFSVSEINSNSVKILNSFFIMDFYDTFDTNTQSRIFTIYNTQILDGELSGGGQPLPQYKLFEDTKNQFYSWFVPKSFIDAQTGSTVIGYVKFSFYSAKDGRLALFYNQDNGGLTTPEKMYFKTELDLDAMTWKFIYDGTNPTPSFPPDAKAFQIPFTNAYSQRVNDAMNNFDNQQQDYPSGDAFNSEDGTYYSTT